MLWYSDGSIQLAANGQVAAGTGTAFLRNVRVGDGLTIAGSTSLHEVTNIASDNQLTFAPPYTGAAGAGKDYRIAPIQGYVKEAADLLRQFTQQFGVIASNQNLSALAAAVGGANKGLMFTAPGAIGTYDLTAQGRSFLAATSQAAQRTALGFDRTVMGVSIADANSLTVEGVYRVGAAWTGSPFAGTNSANQGSVEHILLFATSAYVAQMFWPLSSLINAPMYRRKVADVWEPWQTLWTDKNLEKTVSAVDSANGRVWTQTLNGMYGLGGEAVNRASTADIEASRGSELWRTSSSSTPYGVAGTGLRLAYNSAGVAGELYVSLNNRFFGRSHNGGNWQTPVEFWQSENSHFLPFGVNRALAPSSDNNIFLGVSARRWSTIFAGTGVINTSDAREKTPVRLLTESELAAARDLAAEIGVYRWLAEVKKKGDSAREHIGMTVQRAIKILTLHGLDPFSYGFICYDEWAQETVQHEAEYAEIEVPPVIDEDGNELESGRLEQGGLIRDAWTEVTQEAGDRYSFRMDELYAFIAAGVNQRANDIEARLAALEAVLAQ